MVDPQLNQTIVNIFTYIKMGSWTVSYSAIVLGSTYLGFEVLKKAIDVSYLYAQNWASGNKDKLAVGRLEQKVEELENKLKQKSEQEKKLTQLSEDRSDEASES